MPIFYRYFHTDILIFIDIRVFKPPPPTSADINKTYWIFFIVALRNHFKVLSLFLRKYFHTFFSFLQNILFLKFPYSFFHYFPEIYLGMHLKILENFIQYFKNISAKYFWIFLQFYRSFPKVIHPEVWAVHDLKSFLREGNFRIKMTKIFI